MDQVIFIERLDHRGRVRERHRATELPVRIGRAYTNDVILDDAWASPEHAELQRDETGSLILVDKKSENGTFVSARSEKVIRVQLPPGQTFRIGRTTLRVCTPETAVPPTTTDDTRWLERVGFAENPRRAALMVLALVGILTVADTVTTTEAPLLANAFVVVFAAGLILSVWAGGWALAARLRSRPPQFLQHAAWTCLVVLSIWCLTVLIDYLELMVPRMDSLAVFEGLIDTGLGVLLIVGHLALATQLKPRTRLIVAGALGSSILALGIVAAGLEEGEFTDELVINHTLRPIPTRLLSTNTSERFFADTRDLIPRLGESTMDSELESESESTLTAGGR